VRKVLNVLRVIVNSITFVVMLMLAYAFMNTNPLLALLLVLASFDQFEDVYYYTTGRRLLPKWFMPFDIVFEVMAILLGLAIFIFSLIYFTYFQTWFFKSMLFISAVMMFSAVEDIVIWGRSFGVKSKELVVHRALREEEKERFVRRRFKA